MLCVSKPLFVRFRDVASENVFNSWCVATVFLHVVIIFHFQLTSSRYFNDFVFLKFFTDNFE